MFAGGKEIGEYVPGYTPGLPPSYIPGSAYKIYDALPPATYGSGVKPNVVDESYTANTEENMGGNMFAGDRGIGADEDYGPPTPTEAQKTGQAVVDTLKAQIPLTKTNFLYIAGGAIAVYFAWNYFFKDWISDESQY